MKPNTEQDADRAAFEKWREQQDNSMLRAETAWQTIERAFYAGQAAKADIRAMQDAFERVCGVLSMLNKRQIATWYSNLDGQNSGYYAGWDDAEYAVRQALSLASPFRKGGV